MSKLYKFSLIVGLLFGHLLLAVPVSAASFATGVTLSGFSDCDSPAGLDISMNTDGTVNREGGIVTDDTGATLMSFDQGSSLANHNGTVSGYNFSSPAWSVPPGTVVGLYAYIGSLPYSSDTTIEWFIAYECDTQVIVFSCYGNYGTCPQSVNQIPVGETCPGIVDGRINNNAAFDCAAPVVLYGDSSGLHIYAIDHASNTGYLLIFIAASEYVGITPNSQRLLAEAIDNASGRVVQVLLLPSGFVQVNAYYVGGKPYALAWSPTGGLVRLAW